MKHLDEPGVRLYALQEFERDVESDRIYLSKYQSSKGRSEWPNLLRQALESHNAQWLAAQLNNPSLWLEKYEKRTPSGGVTMAKVPVTAPVTLADGEFQRYYLRAVALHALEQSSALKVVRIRQVERPRSQSEALMGTSVDPQSLLEDLRQNIGIDTILGIPAGPNSGLGVELS